MRFLVCLVLFGMSLAIPYACNYMKDHEGDGKPAIVLTYNVPVIKPLTETQQKEVDSKHFEGAIIIIEIVVFVAIGLLFLIIGGATGTYDGETFMWVWGTAAIFVFVVWLIPYLMFCS